MEMIISILAFLVLLTVLVLIHELGHFAAARSSGVKVEEFGFGLPPRARIIFRKWETDFTLNWIPFGGFVRLKGESAKNAKERFAIGSFASASLFRRVIILTSGVFMNLLLAIGIFTAGFGYALWAPTFRTIDEMKSAANEGIISMQLGVLIREVMEGGPASKAGVPAGSILKYVDGAEVDDPEQVPHLQEGKAKVVYGVLYGDNWSKSGDFAVMLENGTAGIKVSAYPVEFSVPKHGLKSGFRIAVRESFVVSAMTVQGVGRLLKSLAITGRVPEGIAGIVGIAQMTHDSVREGFMVYLRLVAILSLSLAVLNILPFPALDGGRLLFVFAELIGRKPINRRLETITNTFGFMFLICLLLIITYYDVIRLFS